MKGSILIIDCGSSKVSRFKEILDDFGQENVTISIEQLKDDKVHSYAGIIISGAPILVTEIDPKPYLDQFSFIKSYSRPVLGVCFGHQMLGMTFGAEAYACKPARIDQEVELMTDSILFDNIQDFKFNQDHCEAISVPDNWVHLASSHICSNEAMQHSDRPLYGVQFHPETSSTNGEQLLKNFCKSCY
jgi:GMP synthase (glutamine-hydrolysing)